MSSFESRLVRKIKEAEPHKPPDILPREGRKDEGDNILWGLITTLIVFGLLLFVGFISHLMKD